MIVPCLNSDRIYIVAIDHKMKTNKIAKPSSQAKKENCCYLPATLSPTTTTYTTSLLQTIEPTELHQHGVSAPHTTHCLPDGKLMISCLGDKDGNGEGNFLVIDPPSSLNNTFKTSHLWNQKSGPVSFGYDYWYQPRYDVMVSSEWGSPVAFKQGFHPEHLGQQQQNQHYGSSIHFWQWSTGLLKQSIDLATIVPGTKMPLEVRFLHNPEAAEGYVGCALSGNVFRFYLLKDGENNGTNDRWAAEEVINIPSKMVYGWHGSQEELLPALITDILISLDDSILYISAWAFGEVYQYRIENKRPPQLLDVIRIGGLLNPSSAIKIINNSDTELLRKKIQIYDVIKQIKLCAGAQMMQLSLDGRRLYVTNSLHSAWDRQFYPDAVKKHGSQMVKIDILEEENKETAVYNKVVGMKVDTDFLVNFGTEPNGPVLAHEMRYPGGDCTSDIWI